MQLLNELLLVENLGNLRQIDQHLVKMLTNIFATSNQNAKLLDKLGQNSKVEIATVSKTEKKLGDKIITEIRDTDTLAVVLKVNGKQVLILGYKWRLNGGGKYENRDASISVMATVHLFDVIEDDEFIAIFPPTTIKNANLTPTSIVKQPLDMTFTNIKRLFDLIMKKMNAGDHQVELMRIYADVQKAQTGSTRLKDRENWIPTEGNKYDVKQREIDGIRNTTSSYYDKPEYKKLNKEAERYQKNRVNTQSYGKFKEHTYVGQWKRVLEDLKNQFKLSLEKYKASKAITTASPEELIKAVIEKGYMNKIKFMGFTYKYYDDRIRMSSLRNPDSGQNESYIEYRIDSAASEYTDYEKTKSQLRADAIERAKSESNGDKNRYDELMDEYYYNSDKKPANGFKLILGLVGGVITPVKVITDTGYFI